MFVHMPLKWYSLRRDTGSDACKITVVKSCAGSRLFLWHQTRQLQQFIVFLLGEIKTRYAF
ncbi:hypothetical protein Dd703_2976 [Musicola paradisiaca Ech703]|uniref:Uncharacterized protein n=1 Tax=Musicola paradisiaca (strain Ech703) TaxID=579405 RepID=C6CBZ1_MUSP7|nr:hypothetical protein Dd703_2976 [Musicola paradisiaca Ech703]